MPAALQHAQCPLPTNQKVVPSVRYLPTKGHAQRLLPTNWSCPTQHLLPTNQTLCPHASCPPIKGCDPCFLPSCQPPPIKGCAPCFLPTNQWFTCCSPIGCVQCLLPTNWSHPMPATLQPKDMPKAPTKRLCPTPAAHQPKHAQCLLPIKQKVGPHCLMLLSVPLNHKVVPNAHCCTNCVVSKLGLLPHNHKVVSVACCSNSYPLHAAQGCLQYMLLHNCLWLNHHMALPNAYSMHNTCCSPTISLYPMLAAPTIARLSMHTTPHH